jgi:murein DD-endopeptidase MepM/ murein hydrolase activator NlpD
MYLRKNLKQIFLVVIALLFFAPYSPLHAQTIQEIQNQIKARGETISQLDSEIARLAKELSTINQESNTLANIVRSLELTEKKVASEIQRTEEKIKQSQSEIESLQKNIITKEIQFNTSRGSLEETTRSLYKNDMSSLSEILLSGKQISDFLTFAQLTKQLQGQLLRFSSQVIDTKQQMEYTKQSTEEEQKKLLSLRNDLRDQHKIAQAATQEKDSILKETRNEERIYQAMLKERQNKKQEMDQEIRSYESQLQFILDPTRLPKEGTAVLRWPTDNVFITQMFGRTVSARRLYTSGSHSGVDFRASIGTPIRSVADGIVEGVGDTDQTCPRTSFGKWIFIRHYNGLATAYGHLSVISVTEGQKVTRGQHIGYSGATGHVTGPHLHLTVYASHGVDGEEGAQVRERISTTCPGKVYRMPLAPTNAYLDPLLYLPPITASMTRASSY